MTMPTPLAGHHVRLHSGATIGVATGAVRNAVDGVQVEVRWPAHRWARLVWPAPVTAWEHERDLVWVSRLADLGAGPDHRGAA